MMGEMHVNESVQPSASAHIGSFVSPYLVREKSTKVNIMMNCRNI